MHSLSTCNGDALKLWLLILHEVGIRHPRYNIEFILRETGSVRAQVTVVSNVDHSSVYRIDVVRMPDGTLKFNAGHPLLEGLTNTEVWTLVRQIFRPDGSL